MIIVMSPNATKENLQRVIQKIESAGLKTHISEGAEVTIVGVIGEKSKIANLEMNMMDGVEKTVRITEKYKLVSRNFHPEATIVDVDGVKIGGKEIVVMAGPCSVESIDQLREAAKAVKAGGAKFLRGGAFKPRTSPYDFQGLEEEGLKMLRQVADEEGLKVVTEIVDKDDLELVGKYADVYQVGARNMQNFQLLKALGKVKKPVMLKRGLSATISEWLNAAEYIMAGGNEQVILCERGIRTYETFTRNTLDLSAVAAVKELSHLPIIVDPSHGTGRWQMVQPMARAAVAAGCDGLIIEVHPHPEVALSDGDQSLTPKNFNRLMEDLGKIAAVMERTV
ncbi:MAG: 3-deoxy-7-phosphoheptulonate synthase [Selenomonas sp.]|uniref:3-deoxy-7-phosphoheptulonate synthase n=1 Tax=Selenomonas sp. AE3005 TaxID=1485543 RepID=UPI0004819580|nr:3-deoxy-7-phosphoheptulonate synthase [Selenomonas sp. AE3005]MBQ1460693.1 3-deoxy-7-phosphoheptulonate synthase [Selenomonas sp.]MBQ1615080.1 3-deoxy-7-phosphoheptulonate synthase [Selenomonas sp.]MBQ2087059.1 3-deoxy-7-phosphoheptulonate synthase [Selenomonas sp.]MBQ4213485.1 3-deoxy-7-phosphoheptulonate synthase [Selenomonas sp.]MBQ5420371.1 3-deoxy-7-phosphoheptulonate synthase [Selenomonas sp.]